MNVWIPLIHVPVEEFWSYFFCYSGGKLIKVGDSIRLPDDCTIGYIISKFCLFLILVCLKNIRVFCVVKFLKKYLIHSVPKNSVSFKTWNERGFSLSLKFHYSCSFLWCFFFRSHIKSGPHKSGLVSFSFRITV